MPPQTFKKKCFRHFVQFKVHSDVNLFILINFFICDNVSTALSHLDYSIVYLYTVIAAGLAHS